MENTRELLNRLLHPRAGDNIRRKEYPYYDQLALTTGQTEYQFFVTPTGNEFLRNKTLPLSGSEIFFVESIQMYVPLALSTTALSDAMNELLQQSKLIISVDNRKVCELPGLDFISYRPTLNADATPELLIETPYLAKRRLPLPIIMNSTSAFEFKFVTTTAAALAFNTVPMELVLSGMQLDKLDDFTFNQVKNYLFQKVPVTYFDTVVIPDGVERTYQFFANQNKAPNLFSKTFPNSDIQTFDLQNVEVFVNQPDTPIIPGTIFNSRVNNVLNINVNDVEFYKGNLQDMLSVFAQFGLVLTDSAAATMAAITPFNVRQSKTFRVPLSFPAQSKVNVSLRQPVGSLGITGEITVAMRGIETRRVA